MSVKSLSLAAIAAFSFGVPAFADSHITIQDAYARSGGKAARAGAAFMTIVNHGDEADRLIAVASDAAVRVELHTHKEIGDGVMQMLHVEEGFVVPAQGQHALDRGADHVMFMGLKAPWEQGDVLTVTLTFEKSGDMVIEIPVDQDRKAGAGHGHSGHDH